MPAILLPPTGLDRSIAKIAARRTNPQIQKTARTATWAADHHVLLGLAAAAWLVARNNRRRRILTEHVVLTLAAATLAPRLIKKFVDQERPDRSVCGPDRRGVRESGNADDAFPSGHASHVGGMMGALTWIFPRHKKIFWTSGAGIVATRLIVLAHWPSDIAAGLIIGTTAERALRPLTRARLQKISEV